MKPTPKRDAFATAKFAAQPANLLLSVDPQALIGVARMITAIFALVAIYLDPTKPGYLATEARVTLTLYFFFAVILVVRPVRRRIDHPVHLLTHGMDLLVIGGLALLTDELSSPFCTFLPFILLATTVRWGLLGAILGAMALEGVLLLVGWPDLDDGDAELNVLIMRSAYYLVAAIMLGYFGASRDLSRRRLERLAAWPNLFSADIRVWLGSLLGHAANVLGDPQLIVFWQDQEKTTGMVAVWRAGHLQIADMSDMELWSAIDAELLQPADATATFRRLSAVVARSPSTPSILTAATRLRKAYSAPFSGIRYRGELFVINPTCYLEEGASLTTIIAARVAAELERLALMGDIAQSARAEERARLARDLHDSILQDLTAASLRLKATMAHVPEQARDGLALVNAVILDQQRRVRHYVENVQLADEDGSLEATLRNCAASLRQQWNCDIHVEVEPQQLVLPGAMTLEISKLLAEATANAVRHGGATQLELEAAMERKALQLRIADNGTGMAGTPPAACRPPGSMAARVADLHGQFAITHTAPGLAMLIQLPV
ncbi:sensor histidine kinase [Sphingobium cloacae]|uniref:Two-component sensor histidine kinase n=1 Tax=Sphingobium cloacae TaxID=120107 RepID=A0A1E1F570_9SPHN|nr:histidine kinase [Sphingobium cloacae]BAV65647.1 two-component sensor histidine kinase [Sphingobium cloacae]